MTPATPFTLQPAVATALGTSAAVALLLPVALVLAWRGRTRASWRAAGMGALVFVVSQLVLRLPWQIPLGRWVMAESGGRGALFTGFLLLSSLTAGLFEETGRWLGYRYLVPGARSREEGVMFGLGHGGVESILLVGLSLAGTLVAAALLSQGKLPEPAASAVAGQLGALSPSTALAGGFERACAIALHTGLSLVVLQALTRPGGFRWVLLSIGLHSAVNGAAVSLRFLGVWPVEAVVAVASAAVLWAGWRLAAPRPLETGLAAAPAGG